MARATILFAHGSRDPLWSRPMQAVAERMRGIDPTARVECAYLEMMQPDLPGAVRRCVADGCAEIVVVPMFLGAGRHVRQDLPELVAELTQALPDVHIRLQPAIGEDARLVDLLARMALG